jgi:hypothetical protein
MTSLFEVFDADENSDEDLLFAPSISDYPLGCRVKIAAERLSTCKTLPMWLRDVFASLPPVIKGFVVNHQGDNSIISFCIDEDDKAGENYCEFVATVHRAFLSSPQAKYRPEEEKELLSQSSKKGASAIPPLPTAATSAFAKSSSHHLDNKNNSSTTNNNNNTSILRKDNSGTIMDLSSTSTANRISLLSPNNVIQQRTIDHGLLHHPNNNSGHHHHHPHYHNNLNNGLMMNASLTNYPQHAHNQELTERAVGIIRTFRDAGNSAAASGRLDDAIIKYSEALTWIPCSCFMSLNWNANNSGGGSSSNSTTPKNGSNNSNNNTTTTTNTTHSVVVAVATTVCPIPTQYLKAAPKAHFRTHRTCDYLPNSSNNNNNNNNNNKDNMTPPNNNTNRSLSRSRQVNNNNNTNNNNNPALNKTRSAGNLKNTAATTTTSTNNQNAGVVTTTGTVNNNNQQSSMNDSKTSPSVSTSSLTKVLAAMRGATTTTTNTNTTTTPPNATILPSSQQQNSNNLHINTNQITNMIIPYNYSSNLPNTPSMFLNSPAPLTPTNVSNHSGSAQNTATTTNTNKGYNNNPNNISHNSNPLQSYAENSAECLLPAAQVQQLLTPPLLQLRKEFRDECCTVLVNRSSVFLQQRNVKLALRDAVAAVQLDPRSKRALMAQANSAGAANLFKYSLQALKMLTVLDPQDKIAQLTYSRALVSSFFVASLSCSRVFPFCSSHQLSQQQQQQQQAPTLLTPTITAISTFPSPQQNNNVLNHSGGLRINSFSDDNPNLANTQALLGDSVYGGGGGLNNNNINNNNNNNLVGRGTTPPPIQRSQSLTMTITNATSSTSSFLLSCFEDSSSTGQLKLISRSTFNSGDVLCSQIPAVVRVVQHQPQALQALANASENARMLYSLQNHGGVNDMGSTNGPSSTSDGEKDLAASLFCNTCGKYLFEESNLNNSADSNNNNNTNQIFPCTDCYSVHYCSEGCYQFDKPSHSKYLCPALGQWSGVNRAVDNYFSSVRNNNNNNVSNNSLGVPSSARNSSSRQYRDPLASTNPKELEQQQGTNSDDVDDAIVVESLTVERMNFIVKFALAVAAKRMSSMEAHHGNMLNGITSGVNNNNNNNNNFASPLSQSNAQNQRNNNNSSQSRSLQQQRQSFSLEDLNSSPVASIGTNQNNNNAAAVGTHGYLIHSSQTTSSVCSDVASLSGFVDCDGEKLRRQIFESNNDDEKDKQKEKKKQDSLSSSSIVEELFLSSSKPQQQQIVPTSKMLIVKILQKWLNPLIQVHQHFPTTTAIASEMVSSSDTTVMSVVVPVVSLESWLRFVIVALTSSVELPSFSPVVLASNKTHFSGLKKIACFDILSLLGSHQRKQQQNEIVSTMKSPPINVVVKPQHFCWWMTANNSAPSTFVFASTIGEEEQQQQNSKLPKQVYLELIVAPSQQPPLQEEIQNNNNSDGDCDDDHQRTSVHPSLLCVPTVKIICGKETICPGDWVCL